MQTPLPPQCAAKFRAEKLLASGGFGSVWLAVQQTLNRQVAVKVLHHETLADQDSLDRFLNEARITASLNHPNIVKIIDHGVDAGVPWIAYEYVAGQSLREPVKAGGMPWREAVRAAEQVAAALAEAHRQGILHRDIKPDNVLESSAGHYKVADFGIAKWAAEGAVKTQVGVILGTPAYLSPVQISNPPPAAESDLYALGVMLFELLTGRVPFFDESLPELLRLHKVEPAPPPSRFTSTVPPSVDRIVLKLLEKQREDRYASAVDLVVDLERALAEAPDLAATGAVPQPARALASGTATRPMARNSLASSGGASVVSAPPAHPAAWMVAAAFGGIALLAIAGIALRSPHVDPSPAPAATPSPVASASVAATPLATQIKGLDGAVMMLVPEGDAQVPVMGAGGKRSIMKIHVPAFYMDRTEVTNACFQAYARATGTKYEVEPSRLEDPVVEVNWHAATEYCAHYHEALPTEEQWIRAARSDTRTRYPWGDPSPLQGKHAQYKALFIAADVDPADSHPAGHSPFGILNLSGNVAEWCADAYGAPGHRLVKGGSFDLPEDALEVEAREHQEERTTNRAIGFRAVADPAVLLPLLRGR